MFSNREEFYLSFLIDKFDKKWSEIHEVLR